MHTRSVRRPLLALAAAAAALLATPTEAGAHVEPVVSEVPAGSDATLTFEVEHGCGESPTVRVDIQAPDDVTDLEPVEKPGWNATVADNVAAFEWGGSDNQDDGTFEVTFTAPDTPGETVLFPTIQTCTEGSYDWIQEDPDGERPAPRVMVVEASEAPTTTEAESKPTDTAGEVETTELTETTAEAGEPDDESATVEEPADDDGGSSALPLVIGGVVLLALVGGGVYALRRRQTEES